MRKPSIILGLLAAAGALVAVFLAVFGLPYGQLDRTAFAGLYHNGTPEPGLHASIDMIPDAGPKCMVIDPVVNVGAGVNFNVDVCLENVANAAGVGIIDANIFYDDSVIKAPEVANVAPGYPDNPNLDTAQVGPGWDCTGLGLAFPTGDVNVGPPGPGLGQAKIGCFTLANPAPWQSGTGRMFSVNFNAIGVIGNTSAVNIGNGTAGLAVTDGAGLEIGSCNPVAVNPMDCFGGTVNIVAPPTATFTPTATDTPVPTSTPTPVPGILITKVPAAQNLWLENGTTTINEVISAVPPPGLGAFEFEVLFDPNVVSVSVAPGPFLGSTGRTVNCSMSIIQENDVRFGCVSSGSQPAPTGSGIIAVLTVKMEPSMLLRIVPGNNNGIVIPIVDKGCEAADTLGHPLPGTVNGGLTATCDDALVTLRILEGDLNLDCKVDNLDEQAIAFRYGSVFGDLYYDKWFDLEPRLGDFDIDIKDVQKVFGRDGSTCAVPIPPQPPLTSLY